MSTPATDLPGQTAINMLELPGQSALSDFRLARLLGELKQRDPGVATVTARYTYFVHLQDDLTAIERGRLDALLLSGESVELFSDSLQTIYCVPRPGTVSPWSSKATDIVQACGLRSVDRVERGICYGLELAAQLNPGGADAVLALLFDRMTECLLHSGDEVRRRYFQ